MSYISGDEKYKGFCSNGGTCYKLDVLLDHICHCTPYFAGKQCIMQRPVEEQCQLTVDLEILGLNLNFKANCITVDMYFDDTNTEQSQPKFSKFIIYQRQKYYLINQNDLNFLLYSTLIF